MTNRRLAIHAAMRALYDELERLDSRLGIRRCAKLRAIVRAALAAEFHKGEQAARSEQEVARLTYDSDELQRRYGEERETA